MLLLSSLAAPLTAPLRLSQAEKSATGLPPAAGGQWQDANHMFFFMTALSCKFNIQGKGRDVPTPELYRKAMQQKVPFQYYKVSRGRG